MGIRAPKSSGALGSSMKLKNLPSKGSGLEDILKKKDIIPTPETHTAWVQKASYKLFKLCKVTYIMVDLHLYIKASTIIGMLRRVMELDVLRIPLDYLGCTVIAWLCDDDTSEISMGYVGKVHILSDGWHPCLI